MALSTPVPLEFIAGAVIGLVALSTVFYVARHSGRFETEKQLAWVLTFVSCVILTLGSLRYFIAAILCKFDVKQIIYSDQPSLVLLGVFFAYLFLDLVLGIIYYRSVISIVNGYVHHTVYMYLSVFSANRGVAGIFCLMFYNEIPTIVLAVGSIKREWRSDMLFMSLFFVTRIFIHSVAMVKLYELDEHQFIWKIMAAALAMHMYWFHGAITSYLRKQKKDPGSHSKTATDSNVLISGRNQIND